MNDTPKYEVGQTLILRDVNEGRGGKRGPQEVTISRVGRKLVYIQQYGREMAFRIETGVVNDGYGHQSLQTPERYAESKRRAELVGQLREGGLELNHRASIDTSTLERVLAALGQEK